MIPASKIVELWRDLGNAVSSYTEQRADSGWVTERTEERVELAFSRLAAAIREAGNV